MLNVSKKGVHQCSTATERHMTLFHYLQTLSNTFFSSSVYPDCYNVVFVAVDWRHPWRYSYTSSCPWQLSRPSWNDLFLCLSMCTFVAHFLWLCGCSFVGDMGYGGTVSRYVLVSGVIVRRFFGGEYTRSRLIIELIDLPLCFRPSHTVNRFPNLKIDISTSSQAFLTRETAESGPLFTNFPHLFRERHPTPLFIAWWY